MGKALARIGVGGLELRDAGESALLVVLGDRIDPAVNARVHALTRALAQRPEGLNELVPGYASLLVRFDPRLLDRDRLRSLLQDLAAEPASATVPARLVEIPVHYGGDYGPDLGEVAARGGLTPAEAATLHASADYHCYMLGFVAGFPYLGSLPAALACPRLSTPRTAVPAGSVGIAGDQTGIYPRATPGGWRIIGWTPLVLFDPVRAEPALIRPGDRVRFISAEAPDA
ncbi:MAG: 5-oxoprolinase subunit PxpB [Bacillota bacterium]